MLIVKAGAQAALTSSERKLLGLLLQGQTPDEAAETLCLAREESRALVANLLDRNGVVELRHLLVRALVHGWLKN